MTKESEAAGRRALRITDQFRKEESMVYDFRCDDDRLTISIAQRSSQEDEGEWRVRAWVRGTAETEVVTEWGATRAEALQAVARTWAEQHLERKLPTFDWDAVAAALGTVRAL
ncbi:hypothetical protein LVJ94_39250 [Pendulispora rubella]|uniref:Uncharacterized protein n=1 Tax=Pendulispora rubella TaxID=2741070 RepID=A0ABZ2KW81_9BACT